ncbi:GNAT family N-acetyltransferase [Phenylobacterium sp. LjRoot219]|uniref:GNAT family N-acetyltransferase n=1 Tax=Phenylobacterium sp. LjRoot219 TaxID=3342283 RepID=UPI003ECE7FD3
MDVEIRRAGPDDAAALALVGQATFLETYAGQLERENILAHCAHEHAAARYAGWLADGVSQVWIAETTHGRAPVGYAVVAAADLPVALAADDLELKRFYLLSRLHGQGHGARLMETVAADARASGARRLLLGVFSANTRAIAFYARQGFTQAGVRKFRVGEGVYDDLVLARLLAEGG